MPYLTRRQAEKTLVVVESKVCRCRLDRHHKLTKNVVQNVMFDFNVQHDCYYAKCSASGTRPVMQERIASGTTEDYIVHMHSPDEHFVINMHSFHNAHLVRNVLPRNLTAPQPYVDFLERPRKHIEQATRLRENEEKKKSAKRSAPKKPMSKTKAPQKAPPTGTTAQKPAHSRTKRPARRGKRYEESETETDDGEEGNTTDDDEELSESSSDSEMEDAMSRMEEDGGPSENSIGEPMQLRRKRQRIE